MGSFCCWPGIHQGPPEPVFRSCDRLYWLFFGPEWRRIWTFIHIQYWGGHAKQVFCMFLHISLSIYTSWQIYTPLCGTTTRFTCRVVPFRAALVLTIGYNHLVITCLSSRFLTKRFASRMPANSPVSSRLFFGIGKTKMKFHRRFFQGIFFTHRRGKWK